MMKYSKEQTIHLATLLNKTTCLQDVNQLIFNEGCTEKMPFFIHQEELLDMDCVENQLAIEGQRKRFKSMDSAKQLTVFVAWCLVCPITLLPPIFTN